MMWVFYIFTLASVPTHPPPPLKKIYSASYSEYMTAFHRTVNRFCSILASVNLLQSLGAPSIATVFFRMLFLLLFLTHYMFRPLRAIFKWNICYLNPRSHLCWMLIYLQELSDPTLYPNKKLLFIKENCYHVELCSRRSNFSGWNGCNASCLMKTFIFKKCTVV
jgi:hypothetical protein